MDHTDFDPVAFKAAQRDNWNAISAGWRASLDTFERGAAPVTDRLLELGGVRRGQRVLDIATGLGEPALSAARLVGPEGHVVGIDLSPEMLAIARRRATHLSNVELIEADVDTLAFPPDSFDVVLSRWGLMFAVDHVAAFRSVARVLVPGGVLAAAVWGPPARAPMMSVAFQVLSARLELPPPPPGTPGPFSMAEPDALRTELTVAGFGEVEVTEFEVPFWLDSPGHYVEMNRATMPPMMLKMMAERLGSADDPETWAAVAEAVEPYRADGVVRLPSTALLIRATAR